MSFLNADWYACAADCREIRQLKHRHPHVQSGMSNQILFFLQTFLHHACSIFQNMLLTFLLNASIQSQYPRVVADEFLPWPSKGKTDKDGW
jgi:hypothetical protein